MNLEARKIEFIHELLKLQSEEAISRLENFLKIEKIASKAEIHAPMTEEELNLRVSQSESDFEKGRFKNSSELFSKFK